MKELNVKLKTTKQLPDERQAAINIMLSNAHVKDTLLNELKPFGLSLEQFNVLRILRGQKGNPLNLQDVQERMVSKMSNVTRLIDKLILKKLVKRKQCSENRRKIELSITEDGLKQLKIIDPKIDAAEKKVVSNLTKEELKQLNKLLTKIGA
ncbi:MAG: MarR family transcriptional regulator [Bacteroidota bacterium]